jgi:hypothetical protein
LGGSRAPSFGVLRCRHDKAAQTGRTDEARMEL